jgi:hypothetical protein
MRALWGLLLLVAISVDAAEDQESCTALELDPSHKYLLYNVNYGERFNFRKSILRRVLNTVWVLNKTTDYTWVLVVPPFREYYQGTNEFLAWGDVFNVSTIHRAYDHVIELQTYFEVFGNKIDAFFEPVSWEATQEMKKKSHSCAEHVHSMEHGYQTVSPGKEGGMFNIMGHEVEIDKYDCIHGWGCRTSELRDLLRDAATSGARSIFVDHYESIGPPQHKLHPYWEVRQHIRPVQLLRDEASRYVKSWSADGEGGSSAEAEPPRFLAMHMRRGDFKMARAKTQSTEEEIVATIVATAREHDLHTLFLASDASAAELYSLQQALIREAGGGIKVRVYKPMSTEGVGEALFDYRSGAGIGKYALVEQVLRAV